MTCQKRQSDMVRAGTYGKESRSTLEMSDVRQALFEPHNKPFDADVRLPEETVCRILHCSEGNMRGLARAT